MTRRVRVRNALYILMVVLGLIVLVLDFILILTWRYP